MYTITLKDDAVTRAFDRLDGVLDDLTPVMQEIGETLTVSAKDRTRRGESPDGSPLAPRSESTLRAYERRKVRPRGGPLDLTGDLIGSIAYRAGKTSVEVGSSMIYAAVQQFGAGMGAFGATRRGSPIPYGPIPARPYLGLSDDDAVAISEIVGEAIGRALAGG